MRRIDILNKSYQNFLLNIPIPALKNHSLREVFEDAQMVNNYQMITTTGWSVVGGTITSNGEYITITTNGSGALIQLFRNGNNTVNINDKLYAKNKLRTNTNITNLSLRLETVVSGGFQYKIISYPLINQWYEISNVYTVTTGGIPLINNNFNLGASISGILLDVDFYSLINLTLLGIDTLTVSQMDYWYNVFKYF